MTNDPCLEALQKVFDKTQAFVEKFRLAKIARERKAKIDEQVEILKEVGVIMAEAKPMTIKVELDEAGIERYKKLELALEIVRLKHLIPKEHRRFRTVNFCEQVLGGSCSLAELELLHESMKKGEGPKVSTIAFDCHGLPMTEQNYIKPPKCAEPKPDVIPPSRNKQDIKSDKWVTPKQIDEFLKIASDLTSVLYRMEKKMPNKNAGPFPQK